MKDPMKSIPFLPKIVPGVEWGGEGWVMKGWGGSCMGGVGNKGVVWGRVGCVMQGWGGVVHKGVG